MATQLAKLNEAHVSLLNASMGITDVQFCLILLNALPTSYEVMASTILASGAPSALSHTEIIAQIINEEGCQALSGSLLNVARATLIKSSGGKKGKKDHSSLNHGPISPFSPTHHLWVFHPPWALGKHLFHQSTPISVRPALPLGTSWRRLPNWHY